MKVKKLGSVFSAYRDIITGRYVDPSDDPAVEVLSVVGLDAARAAFGDGFEVVESPVEVNTTGSGLILPTEAEIRREAESNGIVDSVQKQSPAVNSTTAFDCSKGLMNLAYMIAKCSSKKEKSDMVKFLDGIMYAQNNLGGQMSEDGVEFVKKFMEECK